RFQKEYYHIDGLISSMLYNTVEGFAFNYGASFTKRIDTLNNRYFSWKGNLRYGFSNKLISANTESTIPLGKTISLNVKLGSDVVDLNNNGSISILGNTINSLFYERNFMKLYRTKFVEANLSSRILGALRGNLGLDYNDNFSLSNTSNYKIRERKNDFFTSNNPFSPLLETPLFTSYQSFKLKLGLSYNFSNKYVTYPTGKYYLPSKWPTLSINYIKAIPNIFNADADFDLLTLGIRKSDIKLGFYGNFSFSADAGKFLNSKSIYYPDLKHFTGNRALSLAAKQNQFLFLDYYLHSTSQEYFEAHAEHNFSGFLINKIPLIRKLKLQEIVGANYLTTPSHKDYSEFYFGLSITGIKVYYGFSYEGVNKVKSGFRIVKKL
ncbi:DUF5686 family protein, partial [Pelobium sp.]